jgi:hypothetical protein
MAIHPIWGDFPGEERKNSQRNKLMSVTVVSISSNWSFQFEICLGCVSIDGGEVRADNSTCFAYIQYIHGVGARLAYYLHKPGPLLHDLGFELLPVRDAIYSPFFTLGLS